jgi:hypothetical protein
MIGGFSMMELRAWVLDFEGLGRVALLHFVVGGRDVVTNSRSMSW